MGKLDKFLTKSRWAFFWWNTVYAVIGCIIFFTMLQNHEPPPEDPESIGLIGMVIGTLIAWALFMGPNIHGVLMSWRLSRWIAATNILVICYLTLKLWGAMPHIGAFGYVWEATLALNAYQLFITDRRLKRDGWV